MKRLLAAIIMALVGVCAAHASEKHALLIGISDYPQHEAKELRWAPIHGANDISLIEGTLRRQGFTITALTDSEATAANARKAFARLVAECRAGDMVYVHFSGHGQAYEDLSGDEDDGWDEALVPYDALRGYRRGVYEGEKHIVDDELGAVFDALRTKVGPKGYVYAVLDACHSGGAARGDEMQDDELFVRGTEHGFTPNGKRYIPHIDRRGNIAVAPQVGMSNICILEACRAYQTNTEIKEDGRYCGPLTYYVNLVLLDVSLSPDTQWVEKVRALMARDPRLIRQNMVSEKSN